MRILFGYDGSEPSDAALDGLASAGLPETGIEGWVVTVADCTSPHLPVSCYLPSNGVVVPIASGIVAKAHTLAQYILEDARASANSAAARLRRTFPAWNVRGSAIAGIARDVLVSTARQWDADLVCVGSHGRSAIGRLVWGSVAQHVLRRAPCSVRIGHYPHPRVSGPDLRTPVRIIVALDATHSSSLVLDAVTGRSWPTGSSARIVVGLDHDRLSVIPLLPPEHEDCALAQARIERAQRSLEEVGLRCDHILRRAEPSHLVLEEASTYDADCIFLGPTAANGILKRCLLGSTAGAVAAKAHCSVEIVRDK